MSRGQIGKGFIRLLENEVLTPLGVFLWVVLSLAAMGRKRKKHFGIRADGGDAVDFDSRTVERRCNT